MSDSMRSEPVTLQKIADSAVLKVLSYVLTGILVPLLFNIEATLATVTVNQAVTTTEISNFKIAKALRDAELADVHKSQALTDSRQAATDARVTSLETRINEVQQQQHGHY